MQRTSGVRHGRHSQVIILSAVPHSIRLATEAADEAGRALQRLRGETAGGCWGPAGTPPDSSISPPATDSQCTCTFVRGASTSCSCTFVRGASASCTCTIVRGRGQCQLHAHYCLREGPVPAARALLSEGGASASCTCTIVRGRGQCQLHVHYCQREGPVQAACALLSEGGASASCTSTFVRGRGQCKLHV